MVATYQDIMKAAGIGQSPSALEESPDVSVAPSPTVEPVSGLLTYDQIIRNITGAPEKRVVPPPEEKKEGQGFWESVGTSVRSGVAASLEHQAWTAATGKPWSALELPSNYEPNYVNKFIEAIFSIGLSPMSLASFVVGGGIGGAGVRVGIGILFKKLVAKGVAKGLSRKAAGELAHKALATKALRLAEASGAGAGSLALFDGASAALTGENPLKAAAKGAAVGAIALGIPSLVARKWLKVGSEIGLFGAVSPVIHEGRAPKVSDFLDAGVVIGALKLTSKVTARFTNAIAKPFARRTPQDNEAIAEEMTPELAKEIIARIQNIVEKTGEALVEKTGEAREGEAREGEARKAAVKSLVDDAKEAAKPPDAPKSLVETKEILSKAGVPEDHINQILTSTADNQVKLQRIQALQTKLRSQLYQATKAAQPLLELIDAEKALANAEKKQEAKERREKRNLEKDESERLEVEAARERVAKKRKLYEYHDIQSANVRRITGDILLDVVIHEGGIGVVASEKSGFPGEVRQLHEDIKGYEDSPLGRSIISETGKNKWNAEALWEHLRESYTEAEVPGIRGGTWEFLEAVAEQMKYTKEQAELILPAYGSITKPQMYDKYGDLLEGIKDRDRALNSAEREIEGLLGTISATNADLNRHKAEAEGREYEERQLRIAQGEMDRASDTEVDVSPEAQAKAFEGERVPPDAPLGYVPPEGPGLIPPLSPKEAYAHHTVSLEPDVVPPAVPEGRRVLEPAKEPAKERDRQVNEIPEKDWDDAADKILADVEPTTQQRKFTYWSEATDKTDGKASRLAYEYSQTPAGKALRGVDEAFLKDFLDPAAVEINAKETKGSGVLISKTKEDRKGAATEAGERLVPKKEYIAGQRKAITELEAIAEQLRKEGASLGKTGFDPTGEGGMELMFVLGEIGDSLRNIEKAERSKRDLLRVKVEAVQEVEGKHSNYKFTLVGRFMVYSLKGSGRHGKRYPGTKERKFRIYYNDGENVWDSSERSVPKSLGAEGEIRSSLMTKAEAIEKAADMERMLQRKEPESVTRKEIEKILGDRPVTKEDRPAEPVEERKGEIDEARAEDETRIDEPPRLAPSYIEPLWSEFEVGGADYQKFVDVGKSIKIDTDPKSRKLTAEKDPAEWFDSAQLSTDQVVLLFSKTPEGESIVGRDTYERAYKAALENDGSVIVHGTIHALVGIPPGRQSTSPYGPTQEIKKGESRKHAWIEVGDEGVEWVYDPSLGAVVPKSEYFEGPSFFYNMRVARDRVYTVEEHTRLITLSDKRSGDPGEYGPYTDGEIESARGKVFGDVMTIDPEGKRGVAEDPAAEIREAQELASKTEVPEELATPERFTSEGFSLPKELSRAKPRYGYRDMNYQLLFPDTREGSHNRALYIVAGTKTLSRRDKDYMFALQEAHPEMSEYDLRARGKLLRDEIKARLREEYAQQDHGDEIIRIDDDIMKRVIPIQEGYEQTKTGEPVTLKGFSGTFSPSEQIIPSPHVQLGGEYVAFNAKDAAELGSKVKPSSVRLENPLIIENDADFNRIAVASGIGFSKVTDMRFGGPISRDFGKLRTYIEALGHDGVIIRNARKGQAQIGLGENKDLYTVFGVDQAVKFNKRKGIKTVSKGPFIEEHQRNIRDAEASEDPRKQDNIDESIEQIQRAKKLPGDDVPVREEEGFGFFNKEHTNPERPKPGAAGEPEGFTVVTNVDYEGTSRAGEPGNEAHTARVSAGTDRYRKDMDLLLARIPRGDVDPRQEALVRQSDVILEGQLVGKILSLLPVRQGIREISVLTDGERGLLERGVDQVRKRAEKSGWEDGPFKQDPKTGEIFLDVNAVERHTRDLIQEIATTLLEAYPKLLEPKIDASISRAETDPKKRRKPLSDIKGKDVGQLRFLFDTIRGILQKYPGGNELLDNALIGIRDAHRVTIGFRKIWKEVTGGMSKREKSLVALVLDGLPIIPSQIPLLPGRIESVHKAARRIRKEILVPAADKLGLAPESRFLSYWAHIVDPAKNIHGVNVAGESRSGAANISDLPFFTSKKVPRSFKELIFKFSLERHEKIPWLQVDADLVMDSYLKSLQRVLASRGIVNDVSFLYDKLKSAGHVRAATTVKDVWARVLGHRDAESQAIAEADVLGGRGTFGRAFNSVEAAASSFRLLMFNVKFGAINMLGAGMNIIPFLGPKYFAIGMRQLASTEGREQVRNQFMTRGAEQVGEFTEVHGVLKRAVDLSAKLIAEPTEFFNRGVAYLGRRQQLLDQGIDPVKADTDGFLFALKTNFEYDITVPRLIRKAPALFRFKTFVANQTRFLVDMAKNNKVKFAQWFGMYILMAGPDGIPFGRDILRAAGVEEDKIADWLNEHVSPWYASLGFDPVLFRDLPSGAPGFIPLGGGNVGINIGRSLQFIPVPSSAGIGEIVRTYAGPTVDILGRAAHLTTNLMQDYATSGDLNPETTRKLSLLGAEAFNVVAIRGWLLAESFRHDGMILTKGGKPLRKGDLGTNLAYILGFHSSAADAGFKSYSYVQKESRKLQPSQARIRMAKNKVLASRKSEHLREFLRTGIALIKAGKLTYAQFTSHVRDMQRTLSEPPTGMTPGARRVFQGLPPHKKIELLLGKKNRGWRMLNQRKAE